MTDPAPWIRFQAKNKVHIIGSFENVHGERFVIWRNENGDTPYFTGDEVDWEPKNRLWPTDFTFNADERAQVAKVLWKTLDDWAPGNASQLNVTYSPELESGPEMTGWRKQHNVPALKWDPTHPVGS
jgi:hypothetical protein